MSCVNEYCCGPLHLLVRESGSSATGSQQPAGSFMLKTVTDMWKHAGLMCSKDRHVFIMSSSVFYPCKLSLLGNIFSLCFHMLQSSVLGSNLTCLFVPEGS